MKFAATRRGVPRRGIGTTRRPFDFLSRTRTPSAWWGPCSESCHAQILIFDRRPLEQILAEYVAYYNAPSSTPSSRSVGIKGLGSLDGSDLKIPTRCVYDEPRSWCFAHQSPDKTTLVVGGSDSHTWSYVMTIPCRPARKRIKRAFAYHA